MKRLEMTASLICGNQEFYWNPDSISQRIKVAREIGDFTQHSTNTIFLSRDYGYPLMYYGDIYGKFWPNKKDMWAYNLRGIQQQDAEKRFYRQFARLKADYFIIEDLSAWREQSDLQSFLRRNFILVKNSENYLIFRFPSSSSSSKEKKDKLREPDKWR